MPKSLKYTLQLLNNARLGSFSEYIFESVFKYENLYRKHAERTDFVWDGITIEIKSKRNFTNDYIKIELYNEKRYHQNEYILIEYYNDCVTISKNREFLRKLEYTQIEQLFQEWLVNRNPQIHERSKTPEKSIIDLKCRISDFFSSKGYKTRIIYRTSQDAFGKANPGNLIIAKVNPGAVTVLILFKDFSIESSNIKEIIAFRDTEGSGLPKIKNTKLYVDKVDLERIENKYKFESIEDLVTNWA